MYCISLRYLLWIRRMAPNDYQRQMYHVNCFPHSMHLHHLAFSGFASRELLNNLLTTYWIAQWIIYSASSTAVYSHRQHPVIRTTKCALHVTPWLTSSVKHHLNLSWKYSATAQLLYSTKQYCHTHMSIIFTQKNWWKQSNILEGRVHFR